MAELKATTSQGEPKETKKGQAGGRKGGGRSTWLTEEGCPDNEQHPQG